MKTHSIRQPTNAGRAIVRVRIKRGAPTRPADGLGYAWRELALGPCLGEGGHVDVAGLFRITR
ncbi:MAG: hypothetical protein ACRDKB_09110 [Actinomycetota bacterium]